jgi:NAD(P)H-flavin reductase
MLCTKESGQGYENGYIGRGYLKRTISNTNQYIYVCGPEKFVEEMNLIVKDLGFAIESIVHV